MNGGRPKPVPGGVGAGRPHSQTPNFSNLPKPSETWAGIVATTAAAEALLGAGKDPFATPGSVRSSVSKGDQRGLGTSGYSRSVPYKGGSTVITNSTHYVVQGDIRADDPEKLGRELKKRERNDNRRNGANARVGV
jgi:hypothetical protein